MSLRTLYDEASLWMTPGGYEDGKLFSELPTDGSGDFTFTRGSNLAATRVGPAGLIEKGRENLLLQSNQFDTTWIKSSGITLTSGQVGYDGTNNAWLVERSAAYDNLYQSNSSFFTPVSTISVYAKAGTYNFLRFALAGVLDQVYFNLTDGSVGTTSYEIHASSQSLGNGWWRLSATFKNNSAAGIYIQPVETDGGVGNAGTGSIYIQDAQLEAGLVATDYIETGASTAQAGILEDMPRLDYSGGASCPALLLEPQRTNLIDNSEYFNIWQNGGTQTIVANATISPQGLQNASSLQMDSGYVYRQVSGLSISSGDKYVWSCYVNSSSQKLTFGGGTTSGTDVYSSEDVGDGWYRQVLTRTFTASGGAIQPMFSATQSGTDLFYIWGAQLEQGSYPTSYIPTYGSSVTRSDDGSHISSMQSNNIVGATDSYTIFFDISNDDGGNTEDGGNSQWLKAQDSPSYSNIWTLRKQDVTDQKYHSLYYNKDSFYVFSNETINKGCFVFTTNEIKVFLDGSLNTTYSVTNSPLNLNGFRIDYGSSDRTSVEFSQLAIFPTALTDSECIALTTL